MSKKITWDDIKNAADKLGIEPCTMSAVHSVESAGDGFLPSGRPKILFEGHVFWKELKVRNIDPNTLASSHPTILYPKWVKSHYKGGEKEYERLDEAILINEEAALSSASWGAFQIMGFNHKACGYDNVFDFVAAKKGSAASQLEAFCGFIMKQNLLRHLKSRDWASFAKGYNGAGYAQNKYDLHLKNAYEKCCKEHTL